MVRSVRAVTKISRKASAFHTSPPRESLNNNSISSSHNNKTNNNRSSRSSMGNSSSNSSSSKPHHEKGTPAHSEMEDHDDVNEEDDQKRLLCTMDEEHLLRFVKETHRGILQRRNQRQQERLRHALTTSRDAVLRGSSSGRDGATNESQPQRRIFPRLPSNSCPPQLVPQQRQEEKEGEDETKLHTSVSVRMRGAKHQWGKPQRLQPILYLEGCHDPLPPSTSTIFLKTHFSTEDEQNLTYVPYFGDDDKEDVVSDVFDLARREKLMEYGTEYRERDTNDTIGETLNILQARLKNDARDLAKRCTASRSSNNSNNDDKMTMELIQTQQKMRDMRLKLHGMLADIMNVSADRISERYNALFRDHLENGAKAHAVGETASKNNGEIQLPSSSSSSLEAQKHATEDESLGKNNHSSVLLCKPTTDDSPTKEYAEVMDSYRNLFCRRCFSYDCNMHGNLPKPNLDIQAELAVEKEKNGDWKELEQSTETRKVNGSSLVTNINATANATTSTISAQYDKGTVGKKRSRQIFESAPKETDELLLTPLQKSLCERVFMLFQGDVDKIAAAMGTQRDAVMKYIEEKKLELKEPKHFVDSKKKKKETTSMKNYNQTWLNRVKDAEIHPAFMPCDHDGPCSDQNCSCVQNAFFCTKHCVWGAKSRNFFRGCNCKAGKCQTKSCACFAAKRECDPDLCHTCGACTDPPGTPATTQRCRNDNIGMRRHCHLLLAKSSIEDAGWGVYTKHALKRGDFVHEYLGEVISQEEAERRGRVYDKVNRSYLFNLSSDYVVDASRKGNKTKFANHSSKPNCYTKMVCVNGDIRIGLFAKEDVEPQSELFFDYRYDVGMDNDLIIKPGKTVDWMKNPKMANKISKKYA